LIVEGGNGGSVLGENKRCCGKERWCKVGNGTSKREGFIFKKGLMLAGIRLLIGIVFVGKFAT
jgi:hypothetical protein